MSRASVIYKTGASSIRYERLEYQNEKTELSLQINVFEEMILFFQI